MSNRRLWTPGDVDGHGATVIIFIALALGILLEAAIIYSAVS